LDSHREAGRILRWLEFHYTPKDASWLNMVEIEIGVRRCAEKFTSESLAAYQAMAAKRRQGVAPDWAHH
jgi:hypothetical protein